jgi:hypothetical protein
MKKIIFTLTFVLISVLSFGQGKISITTNINSGYADSSGVAKNALKLGGVDASSILPNLPIGFNGPLQINGGYVSMSNVDEFGIDGYINSSQYQNLLFPALFWQPCPNNQSAIYHNGRVNIGLVNDAGLKFSVCDTLNGYVSIFRNIQDGTGSNAIQISCGSSANTAGATYIGFFTGGVSKGSIKQTTTGVAYNVTSDSTLKTNIRLTHYGIQNLMKLKPVDFNWKSDNSKTLVTGFLAQDVYNVYPDAVSKPLNATDKWQMSREALVPLLVKSIQDQQAEITELTKRIEKLEKLIK